MLSEVIIPKKPEAKNGQYSFLVTEVYANANKDGSDMYVSYRRPFPADEVDIEEDNGEYRIAVEIPVKDKFPADVMIYPVIED